MIREILIPTEPTVHLRVPAAFVGKRIEVTALEVTDVQPAPGETEPELTTDANDRAERLAAIQAIFANHQVDLRGFKFDRDEANNYEDE